MRVKDEAIFYLHFLRLPYTFSSGSFSLFSLPGRLSMAKRASTSETLELYGEQVSAAGRLRDIEHLFDTLSVAELRAVRMLAETKRKAKLADAKATVLAEMAGRVKALGLTMKDVFPSHKSSTKATIPVKYRSPTGDRWSGRGHTPTWLRTLEAQGHDREEFLVTEG
jgi:DNA-binding protein H-NS